MLKTPNDIAGQLRSQLPADKKEASWGYLAGQFPWYPMVHILRASDHPNDLDLLQKAALYHPDVLRLNVWLHQKEINAEEIHATSPVISAGNELIEKEISDAEPDNPVAEDHQATDPASPGDEVPLTITEAAPSPTPAEAPGQQTVVAGEPAPSETDTLEDLIPITPYHTVDYFASQGIKAALAESNTQLDKQVKSFTEWLKTMKKLKYQPATAYTDPLVEVKAKASVHKKEVVTEAMAEVWAKQGDFEHAAQIYAKLMLLHPEKTPYFAARLKELKEKQ